MKLLNETIETQLKDLFKALAADVTIALFTEGDCETCVETTAFMEEISALDDKLHLVRYDLKKDAALAASYHVTMVPSIVLLDAAGGYRRIKFNGIPAGHEINSFIPALLEVSGAPIPVPPGIAERVDAIRKPVDLKVFVTLSCPHCPGAVQKAQKLALMNPNIEAEMIESQTFSELAQRFNVTGVPKIVVNGKTEVMGNVPFEALLDAIEAG